MADIQALNIEAAVQGWAEITVERLHEALDDYEIGQLDDELWRSIAFELKRSNGNVEAVLLKFRMYGRFVDMRVGRGNPIGSLNNAKKAGQYGRKKKPWYSKTKTRETAILRSLLVREYGVQTLAVIESGITTTENVNI